MPRLSVLSRRAAPASIPAAAAAATGPSLANTSSVPSPMMRAIAEADAAWHRFWTATPPAEDKNGELFTRLGDLAREAQMRALKTPVESTGDAVALLAFARRQLVTWHVYDPDENTFDDDSGNQELDWIAFERACQYLGAGGPVPHRA